MGMKGRWIMGGLAAKVEIKVSRPVAAGLARAYPARPNPRSFALHSSGEESLHRISRCS